MAAKLAQHQHGKSKVRVSTDRSVALRLNNTLILTQIRVLLCKNESFADSCSQTPQVARVWKEGSTYTFVEWSVNVMLESDMAHAFTDGTNTDMVATDTQKNTVRPWLYAMPCIPNCDTQTEEGLRRVKALVTECLHTPRES